MPPRLGGRHPEDAQKRRELDGATERASHIAVELPANHVATREGGAPIGRPNLVDRHGEGLTGARTANLNRPGERVALVVSLIARLEALVKGELPAGIGRREANRVPWVDRQDRLEVAREAPMKDARLQRQLVEH
jgi:hypothetical protein